MTEMPAQLALSQVHFGHQPKAQLSRPPPSPLTLVGNSSPVPLRKAWGAVGWWCRGHAHTVRRSVGRRTVERNSCGDPGDTARCSFPVVLPKSEWPPVLTPARHIGIGCGRALPHPWPPLARPSRQVPLTRRSLVTQIKTIFRAPSSRKTDEVSSRGRHPKSPSHPKRDVLEGEQRLGHVNSVIPYVPQW